MKASQASNAHLVLDATLGSYCIFILRIRRLLLYSGLLIKHDEFSYFPSLERLHMLELCCGNVNRVNVATLG